MVGLAGMYEEGRDSSTGIRSGQFSCNNPALPHSREDQLPGHRINEIYRTLIIVSVLPRHVQQRLGLGLDTLNDVLINVHVYELKLL